MGLRRVSIAIIGELGCRTGGDYEHARHYETNTPISDELIEKIEKVKSKD